MTSERNQLKESVSKFGVDSTMLIRESEEQTRQVEQQYEKKLEYVEIFLLIIIYFMLFFYTFHVLFIIFFNWPLFLMHISGSLILSGFFSQRDKLFNGKLQQKDLEWQSDIAQLRATFANEKGILEAQLKNSKSEENKLKDKLMEAEAVSICLLLYLNFWKKSSE